MKSKEGKSTTLTQDDSDIKIEKISDDFIWTWRDAAQRMQQIDTIVENIVHNAILLDSIFFTAFGVLYTQGSKLDNGFTTARQVIIVITMSGCIINILFAKGIARQEYLKKWYFQKFFPKSFLFPQNDLPNNNKSWLVKFGRMKPSYIESWVYILLYISVIFLLLTMNSLPKFVFD